MAEKKRCSTGRCLLLNLPARGFVAFLLLAVFAGCASTGQVADASKANFRSPSPMGSSNGSVIIFTVVDSASGRAIAGANVEAPSLRTGGNSNREGKMYFVNVPEGQVTFYVRFVGRELWERDVDVRRRQSAQMEAMEITARLGYRKTTIEEVQ